MRTDRSTIDVFFAGSEPPPGKEDKDGTGGWSKAKLPDGRMIWVAAPKNAVERVSSILVIERKSTSARYYCLKCNSTFSGSKKRIKEHMRCENKDVKHCTVPPTPEEEAIFLEDDEQDVGRGSKHNGQHGDGDAETRRKRKRQAVVEHRISESQSPFPCTDPAPAPEGWRKAKDPRFGDDRLMPRVNTKADCSENQSIVDELLVDELLEKPKTSEGAT